MLHLLDPAHKLLIENKVRAATRISICSTCPDSVTNTVMGKHLIVCSFCGCVMQVKTVIPSSTCANLTNPLW